jgi:hypothetical protein
MAFLVSGGARRRQITGASRYNPSINHSARFKLAQLDQLGAVSVRVLSGCCRRLSQRVNCLPAFLLELLQRCNALRHLLLFGDELILIGDDLFQALSHIGLHHLTVLSRVGGRDADPIPRSVPPQRPAH